MKPCPPTAIWSPAYSRSADRPDALRLGRRPAERRLGRDAFRPDRLDDRLEDRQRHPRAGRAAAERAALAVAVVVADPDRDGHVVGEADEPAVDRVLGRAGLAGDVRRQPADRARGAARHHALQHGLELIERGRVGGGDPRQRRVRILKDGVAAVLDRIDGVRLRQRAFVGDRGVEARRDRSCAPAGRRARTDNSGRNRCRFWRRPRWRRPHRDSVPDPRRCRHRAGARSPR